MRLGRQGGEKQEEGNRKKRREERRKKDMKCFKASGFPLGSEFKFQKSIVVF